MLISSPKPRTTRLIRLALRRLFDTESTAQAIVKLLDAPSRAEAARKILGVNSRTEDALSLKSELVREVLVKLYGKVFEFTPLDEIEVAIAEFRAREQERTEHKQRIARPRIEGGKINFGCGVHWREEGWLAVDKCHRSPGAEGVVQLDALQGELLDIFELNSVECVFTSHTFEHFTVNEVQRVLGDLFAVMRPGAPIRISVPDLDICVEKMYERDHGWWQDNGIQTRAETALGLNEFKISRNFLRSIGAVIEDWHFKRGDASVIRGYHFTAFNFAILSEYLRSCGFESVKKKSFEDSDYEYFAGLDNRPQCSLFVEAQKPFR